MKDHFLEIENFSCGYDQKFHINEISFHLPKGCFAGIIGPNGSGKTTLFRGVSGELITRKGFIKLDSKNLKNMGFKEKARSIAVVSQIIESPDITVEDYVLLGRTPYQKKYHFFESRTDFEIAEKYMKLTCIYEFREKYLTQMSGGEQQLAAIARALTQEPDLLLLDEPTSHLDITHQVEVLNLIQRLNEQLGLTVLMNIHDLNLAGEYCDYLIMLKNGLLHTKGKPEEVLNYKHIEDVYETVVITRINPVSKKPVVFLVSEKVLGKMNKPNGDRP